jgi:bifunctional non-homologous end joining protein LigD
VSVPLDWDELDPKDDLRARFNVSNVPKRLARLKDPWAGYRSTRQAVSARMKKALDGA